MAVNISKPRGDTIKISFGIKISGTEFVMTDTDRLFFTIKKTIKDEDFLFQYTFGNGITYDSDNKKYKVLIPSSDTKTLDMGKSYSFDIELVRDFDETKDTTTLCIGELSMTDEVTRSGNEGS